MACDSTLMAIEAMSTAGGALHPMEGAGRMRILPEWERLVRPGLLVVGMDSSGSSSRCSPWPASFSLRPLGRIWGGLEAAAEGMVIPISVIDAGSFVLLRHGFYSPCEGTITRRQARPHALGFRRSGHLYGVLRIRHRVVVGLHLTFELRALTHFPWPVAWPAF